MTIWLFVRLFPYIWRFYHKISWNFVSLKKIYIQTNSFVTVFQGYLMEIELRIGFQPYFLFLADNIFIFPLISLFHFYSWLMYLFRLINTIRMILACYKYILFDFLEITCFLVFLIINGFGLMR